MEHPPPTPSSNHTTPSKPNPQQNKLAPAPASAEMKTGAVTTVTSCRRMASAGTRMGVCSGCRELLRACVLCLCVWWCFVVTLRGLGERRARGDRGQEEWTCQSPEQETQEQGRLGRAYRAAVAQAVKGHPGVEEDGGGGLGACEELCVGVDGMGGLRV